MSDQSEEDHFIPEDAPETSMAEEPIEDRLLRAWLNGFREGATRAHHGGRWDHS